MPIIDSPEKTIRQTSNLLEWLMPKLTMWRQYRDNNYKEKWNEYYRLWRGIWTESDKTRQSERSRLINPALQQAIEASVAEIEEATFGRGIWFDVRDDVVDPEKTDVEALVPQFREDLEEAGAINGLCDSVLIGALYGTGIGEILVEEVITKKLVELPIPGTNAADRTVSEFTRFKVLLNPVMPNQFLIDPVAKNLEDGLGFAIEDIVSKHKVLEDIQRGYYNKVVLGGFSEFEDKYSIGENTDSQNSDKVKIIRYYGKVPKIYLKEANENKRVVSLTNEQAEEWKDDEWDLEEAFVVIANDRIILKAIPNPYLMKDRPAVFFQWDRVPNRFWGRGVAEKGYNPQKALDAELRARIDAMSLTTHPMMGVDATRLPRGMKFEVAPGKTILTNGPPGEILAPIKFGDISPSTFTQSGELERMIQMGTGALDSAVPAGISPRNATAGGMSMMLGASIKRQKRNLQNFQKNFLEPFSRKALWRYMQFEPKRYPVLDTKFKASGTLGIMAREYEQQQFIQLLSVTNPESPMFPIIVKGIMDNSSVQNRLELMSSLEQAMAPNPEKEQLEMALQQAQIDQIMADSEYKRGQLEGIKIKAQLDVAKIELEKQQLLMLKPETQLEAAKQQVDAKAKELELQLKEREIDQDYDIRQKELALEAEKIKAELYKIPEMVPTATLSRLENKVDELQSMNKVRLGEKKIIVERNDLGEIVALKVGE